MQQSELKGGSIIAAVSEVAKVVQWRWQNAL